MVVYLLNKHYQVCIRSPGRHPDGLLTVHLAQSATPRFAEAGPVLTSIIVHLITPAPCEQVSYLLATKYIFARPDS